MVGVRDRRGGEDLRVLRGVKRVVRVRGGWV